MNIVDRVPITWVESRPGRQWEGSGKNLNGHEVKATIKRYSSVYSGETGYSVSVTVFTPTPTVPFRSADGFTNLKSAADWCERQALALS